MEFEKLIGKKFQQIASNLTPYTVENNDFLLKLKEGIDEEFHVTANDRSYEMILSKNKVVQTIFIYPSENGDFPFREYSVEMGRNTIRDKWGKPDKQGEPISNGLLGESGGFDRFDKEISYHFEYLNDNQTQLKKITLMTRDFTP